MSEREVMIIGLVVKLDSCTHVKVVQTMLAFFFAAIINTGIGSAWLILHIANNPKWANKIAEEQKKVIDEYKCGEPGDGQGTFPSY